MVPVKDAPAGMRPCLESLLRQNYPDYEVVFTMQDEQDPALAVVQAAQAAVGEAGPVVRTAFAGQAGVCGQKNWNQLAGLKALNPMCAIFAFCDSTHVAPSHWLPELVRPVAAGEAVASTAYHHVFPRKRNLASLGRTISVLALYMMQEIPGITQPWGGSMAISRKVFEELNVADIWGQTVVDDVSLAVKLEGAGYKAQAVPEARMDTDLASENIRDWALWLKRQWLYLKFLFPGSWIAVGLLLYLQFAMLLLGLGGFVLGLMGAVPLPWFLLGCLHLGTCCGLGLWARRAHPEPAPPLPWLSGFFATLAMAAISHGLTLPERKISWRGISYLVGRQGKVRNIERS